MHGFIKHEFEQLGLFAPGSERVFHLPIVSAMLTSSPQGYTPPTI